MVTPLSKKFVKPVLVGELAVSMAAKVKVRAVSCSKVEALLTTASSPPKWATTCGTSPWVSNHWASRSRNGECGVGNSTGKSATISASAWARAGARRGAGLRGQLHRAAFGEG